MAQLFIVGPGAESGGLAVLLSRSHPVRAADRPTSGHGNFNEEAKSCDVLLLCGDETGGRLIADEIWHLLRNKPVVSLIPAFTLSDLREMYPLSKVARCKVCSDGAADRALFLLTVDKSYSDREISLLTGVVGESGEPLLVPENVLERLSGQVEASRAVVGIVVEILKESMKGDRDLYGFVLDWVLYGMGSSGINGEGSPLQGGVGNGVGYEDMQALRAAVNQALASLGRKEAVGGS